MGHNARVLHKMLTFPKKIKTPYDEDASIKKLFFTCFDENNYFISHNSETKFYLE